MSINLPKKNQEITENQECRFHTVPRNRQSAVGIEYKSLKIKIIYRKTVYGIKYAKVNQ